MGELLGEVTEAAAGRSEYAEGNGAGSATPEHSRSAGCLFFCLGCSILISIGKVIDLSCFDLCLNLELVNCALVVVAALNYCACNWARARSLKSEAALLCHFAS
jgi:hypothetical protein